MRQRAIFIRWQIIKTKMFKKYLLLFIFYLKMMALN